MQKVLLVILVLLLAGMGITYAQDPGIRDTVRFGDWGVYLPCPPCSGIATVPIFAVHDESLETIKCYLKSSGPVEICTVQYSPELDSYFEVQSAYIPSPRNFVAINLASFI